MRYPPDQKAETRQKLVREAAARMRKLGPDGVGVADLMRGIGLTHGGFYAHFASKDDLIAQTVTHMFNDGAERHARALNAVPPPNRLETFFARYVSAAHRDRPDRGCPLTTIAGDMPRQSSATRDAFDAGVARLTAIIASILPAPDETLAASLLNEMAGAVALSRAVSNRTASDRILAVTAASIRHRAGIPPPAESDLP